MVPFFGTKLPKGYVWADGVANWPNADWVPIQLRGAKVPDMQEYLVGGAKDADAVGKVWDQGKLVIPAFTVKGTSFSIPAAETEANITGEFRDKEAGGSKNALVFLWHNENWCKANRKGEPNHLEISGYRYTPVYAKYRYPKGTLAGVQTLQATTLELNAVGSNPRHVMCRWIIRIK
jgi:hypothetical protein